MIGNWYYFNETGHLTIEVSNITEGKFLNKSKEFESFFYKNKSYLRLYYPNGKCKEEGFALYNDLEYEIEKIGNWISYDEFGKVNFKRIIMFLAFFNKSCSYFINNFCFL
jgi:hypothetical protein